MAKKGKKRSRNPTRPSQLKRADLGLAHAAQFPENWEGRDQEGELLRPREPDHPPPSAASGSAQRPPEPAEPPPGRHTSSVRLVPAPRARSEPPAAPIPPPPEGLSGRWRYALVWEAGGGVPPAATASSACYSTSGGGSAGCTEGSSCGQEAGEWPARQIAYATAEDRAEGEGDPSSKGRCKACACGPSS